jgi:hypothetical protein
VWVAGLVGLLAATTLATPVRAADLDKLDCSLKWIPADAAFYSTMLRNREQFDAIRQSRAWAQLQALPVVQMAWQHVQAELNKAGSPVAQFQKFAQQPENRQLLELLGDMVSHEIFIYGDESVAGFTDLAGRISGATRFGPLFMQFSAAGRGKSANELQAIAILQVLKENLELIKVPNVVLGFKLSKAEPAETQLKRLEGLLTALIEKTPELKMLKGRLTRTQAAGSSFLTLTLDGSLVPWQQIPFDNLADKPGEYEPLIKKLSQLKLTLQLGVRNGYLLLSLGESSAHLARLGQGQALTERAELKPLERFADQRLTAISYLSKGLHAKLATTRRDIDDLVEQVQEGLKATGLTPEQQARIQKDLKALAEDLKRFVGEPGAKMSFSFLTQRGQESYSHDWSEQLNVDATQPLTLLEHVGGSPVLAVVGRSKPSPEPYQLLVKWLKVIPSYLDEFVVPHLEAEQKAQYQKALKAFQPLLSRLDETTSKMLLPALADGQVAFVLDAKLTSQQWHLALPPAAKPLPLPELALVIGVKDADLLQRAMGEYRSIANEMIARIRELAPPGEIPAFQIPPPKTQQLKAGTSYFYPLPAQLGLERRILPNAGLGDKVAALTLSQDHTERLLTRTPLKIDGGPLAKPNRPLVAAAYVDCAAFVDAATPWVEWGVRTAMGADAQDVEEILKQVRTGLAILKVFRSITSATYVEGGARVTHSETVIRDL